MKLPNLPEENPQEEKPKPRYETKVVVHKPRVTPPSKNTERKPVTLFGKNPAKPDKKKTPSPAPVAPSGQEPDALSETGTTLPSPESVNQPAAEAPSETTARPPVQNGRGINPGLKLRAVEAAGRNVTPAALPTAAETVQKPSKKTGLFGNKAPIFPRKTSSNAEPFFDDGFFDVRRPELRKSLRAARKIGGFLSLVVNVILLGIVLVMMARLNALNSTLNSVLGGLYDNFVNMDNATIVTTINVEDMPIPVQFDLEVVQPETNVTLTRAVTIYGARVTINSGALTIDNAPATVTLPANTVLPVSLSMTVPVDKTLYVDLQVPVNIDLAQSNPAGDGQVGLHDAFLGLQNTIGPFYCLFKEDLLNTAGGLICQQGVYNRQDINP